MENKTTTKLKIKGNWNELKGKLKQKYSQLTDDDLLYVEGKEDELAGRLEKRLGKTAEQVTDIVEELEAEMAQDQSEQTRKGNQEEANRPKMTEPGAGQPTPTKTTESQTRQQPEMDQSKTVESGNGKQRIKNRSDKTGEQEIAERAETGQPKIPDQEALETEESPETDYE